jgi:tetratricopeptide (TPR) repeat protein
VALDPHSADAYLNVGIALADQYQTDAALEQFSKAAQLAPASAAAHYNKGRALFDLRRDGEALPELEHAVRLEPNHAGALYLLAMIDKQAGNPEHSAKLLEKVIELQPDNSDALYMLGQNLSKMGRTAEAVARWKQALSVSPEHAEALYNLTRALAKSDPAASRQYEARFTALQEKRQITDRAETLGNFAIASAAARDWRQAIAQLTEALKICGDCRSLGDLHKDLGLIYCRSGDLKDGQAELLQAKKSKPDDPDVQEALQVIQNIHRDAHQ